MTSKINYDRKSPQNFGPDCIHGLAVSRVLRAGDRSYMTGAIRGWSRSHLTHIPGGCLLKERKLTSQSPSITVQFSFQYNVKITLRTAFIYFHGKSGLVTVVALFTNQTLNGISKYCTMRDFLARPIRRETTRRWEVSALRRFGVERCDL